MGQQSLAEAITHSFYAWEVRGRGWTLAQYPVDLEPPFRPCYLLPEDAAARVSQADDGKRHTFVSGLIERLLRKREQPSSAPTPAAEPAPFPRADPGPLCTLQILVPLTFESRHEVTRALTSALSTVLYPVAFEVVGNGGRVTVQITVAKSDVAAIAGYLEAFVPEVGVVPVEDALRSTWMAANVRSQVELGLAQEFFLPLQPAGALPLDAYVPLVSALAQSRAGECVVFQALVTRTENPWAPTIREALSDGSGGCIMADAPWFLDLAKQKTAFPLYAVALRIGAAAQSEDRTLSLVRGTHAFIRQFANPNGNELVVLDPGTDSFADRADEILRRESCRTGMLLSADELVGLLHVPDRTLRGGALTRLTAHTKALPAHAKGHAFVLGENEHRGIVTAVSLEEEARFAHLWTIGASGTGKSTLLANLALQDISAGNGVAVFDVHGDLIDDILARLPESALERVVLFDPSDTACPVGFNILEAESEVEATLLAADLVAIFRRFATSWGDVMSTVLAQATLAILSSPPGGSLVELKRFLVQEGYRQTVLATITDPAIHSFWEHEYPQIGTRSLGPLLARVDAFLRMRLVRNIVGQPRGLKLGPLMDTGHIVLVHLAKGQIGEENAYLLGSLLLAKLTQRALMRQTVPREKRQPFFAYIDECQHFVSPSLESLATEGRKYRVGLALAHQTRAQLAAIPSVESAILGNCHTRIVFRVGEDDARSLAPGFASFEPEDLSNLGRGEAIARIGGARDDFNLRTLPLPPVPESERDRRIAAVRDQSRARYGTPVAPLVPEVSSVVAADPPIVADATLIEPVEVPVVPQPTPRAEETPRRPRQRTISTAKEPAQTGRGGGMHKYLQHLVKRLGEERGFRATVEGAAGSGQVDVTLTRGDVTVACEISITTDATHELANVRKCLTAGCTRLFVISPERRRRLKLQELIRAELPRAPVDVIGPEDLVPALDALDMPPEVRETTVRGYKVKVSRQELTPEEVAGRRSAIAEVIARSLRE